MAIQSKSEISTWLFNWRLCGWRHFGRSFDGGNADDCAKLWKVQSQIIKLDKQAEQAPKDTDQNLPNTPVYEV